MSTHEYAYGEFFLAIDLEGRTFHYVVESVDGRIDLGSNRVESWLVVGRMAPSVCWTSRSTALKNYATRRTAGPRGSRRRSMPRPVSGGRWS